MSDGAAIDFLASKLAKWRPWVGNGRSPQREFLKSAEHYKTRVFRAGNRAGKLQPKTEPVFTPSGFRPIGSLTEGSEVVCGCGKATTVTGVFQNGIVTIYKVTFNDHSWTRCGMDHLWKVKDRNGRFAPDPHRGSDPALFGQFKTMPLRDIVERWGYSPKPLNRVAIPLTKPIDLPRREVPIDPYVLGALLGDGGLTCVVGFTTADEEMVSAITAALPRGHSLKKRDACFGYAVVGTRGPHDEHSVNEVMISLRGMGLFGKRSFDKWVPELYLMNDQETRLAVLQGLMDTDGTVGTMGHVEFSTTSHKLAENVQFLIQSLGGKSRIRSRVTKFTYLGVKKNGRVSYRVSARIPGVNPFRLTRKADRYNESIGWTYDRALVSVVPDGEEDSVCIQVACECQTYITRDMIVTHNSSVGVIDVLLQAEGWHPYVSKTAKPPKGWIVTLDWDTGVGQILWPKIKEFIDPSQVKIGWLRRSGVEVPNYLFFKRSGAEIFFKSAESDRSKFQGTDLDFAWIDEELDQGIVEEVRARLVDRGGRLAVTLTPVSRKAWVRDLEKETYEGKPTTKVIRASMRDAAAAGILDFASVERYLAGLPERQRRVREFGDFASLEGRVYPDFAKESHVLTPKGHYLVTSEGKAVEPWPLPKHWFRYAAVDFGYAHATAVVVIAENPDTGRWIVERCYYAPGIRASRWAEILSKELPPLACSMVADHQAFERAEFSAAGVATVPATKDVVPGLEAVERALYPLSDGRPKLQIVVDDANPPVHPVCGRTDGHWLVWEFEGYRYPEPKEKLGNRPKDLPVKKDDDLMDSLRYLVMLLTRRGGANAPEISSAPDKVNPFEDSTPPSPWRNHNRE